MSELTRRSFLLASAAAPALLHGATMTPKERIEAALRDASADRPPFTLWHHFGLEKQGAEAHAKATLQFHHDYRTDLVKVMSDFPYPRPSGAWYELKPVDSPFPEQLKALELIREGLKQDGRNASYFVETLFNPWNVAEKLSSPAEVQKLRKEQPQKLLDALQAIAKSEINHAKAAMKRGAAGIFLAVANAQDGILTREEYAKFSEPFDKQIFQSVAEAPLNIIHLHGPKVYVDYFAKATGWKISGFNYSMHETGYSLRLARHNWHTIRGAIVGGLDHREYRNRTVEELREDIRLAVADAGKRLIVTPGCSVPNDSTPEELRRLGEALGAFQS
jgi:uroporphyrinogen decarboxylase